jgi:DNA-binding NtrC family response regulator/tetratricopeptide (TPR) repeat protein/serine/threonine protein kinase
MQTRYQIRHPMEGGPGVSVYLVSDLWEKETLKVMTLVPLDPQKEAVRIEEIYSLRTALDHPLLSTVHDLSLRGKRVGFVTDYLEGSTSGEAVWSASGLAERQSIAFQLADLLAYLHTRGFHCGYLSPAKLFRRQTDPLLANFLFPKSRVIPASHSNSIRYASPEMIREGVTDRRSDLYSLGMLYYHLFTGTVPYGEDDADTIKLKQFLAYPVEPRKVNPDIPSSIERLILDLIQKDPQRRPDRAEYVCAVLEEGVARPTRPPLRFRSPLVGREPELEHFRSLVEEHLKAPKSRVLAVGGPAGIGKSRLLEQFQIIAKIRGVETTILKHHPDGGTFQVLQRIPVRYNQKATKTVSDPSEDGDDSGLLKTVVSQSLELITQARLVFVDDMQWVDEGSSRVYTRLMSSDKSEILLVVTFSSDQESSEWNWLGGELDKVTMFQELTLAPLADAESQALCLNLMGYPPSAALLESLVPRCAGSPFYLSEHVRYLYETGILSLSEGYWICGPTQEDPSSVPLSICAHIGSRLRLLRPEDKRALVFLSVLELPISAELLARVLRVSAGEMYETMQRLERADLISLSGSLFKPMVNISHSWITDVIRSSLAESDESRIHGEWASVLLSEYESTADINIQEALVLNLMRTDKPQRAAPHFWAVIDRLERAELYRHAADLLEKALHYLAVDLTSWDLLNRAVQIFYRGGKLESSCRLAEQCAASSAISKDKRAFLLSFIVRACLIQGRMREGISACEEGLALLADQSPRPLYEELQFQLLCCLVRTGDLARAESIATEILEIQDQTSERFCHALYLFFYYLKGSYKQAITWERQATESAFKHGEQIRYIGRLLNLGTLLSEMGRWSEASSIARYCRGVSESTGNSELSVYSRSLQHSLRRKLGQHSEAMADIHDSLLLNARSTRNQYAESELLLEAAKNCSYQLNPEIAVHYLDGCLAAQQDDAGVRSTQIDERIARGWSLLLLGRSDEAFEAVSGLDPEEMPRERGRLLLLRGKLHLELGQNEEALTEAHAALACYPTGMPYYRTRAIYLLAEVLLARDELTEAEKLLKQGLEIACSKFYVPLMVRGHLLKAEWLFKTGRHGLARVHCLRSLQLSREVERPGLYAEIYHMLGRTEAVLQRRENALQHYARALQLLKERMLNLSPENRESFSRRYIEPIERDRARLLSETGSPISLHTLFSILRRLISTAQSGEGPAEVGNLALAAIGNAFEELSANLFVSPPEGGDFALVASLGRCGRSGRHLLETDTGGPAFVFSSDPLRSQEGKPTFLGIPLRSRSRCLGLLYVESTRSAITEAEIDFLGCVAAVLEGHLAAQLETKVEQADISPLLVLRDGTPIIGTHARMASLFAEIRKIAPSHSTVLISGESGTGKELVARAIHDFSRRFAGPFVAVNCSALPADLIESELFGHRRGSFTGALVDKKGLFEAAGGGTLFLDEIATMPVDLQGRLLRAIEQKRIRRIGETHERPVDVRIVTATNQPLPDLVRLRLFREDLYHRLNVHRLQLPPLRERASDIPVLVNGFVKRLNQRERLQKRLAAEAISMLQRYQFPGNVRELENIVESAYQMCEGTNIRVADIAGRLQGGDGADAGARSRVQSMAEELAAGRLDFWTGVRDRFLNRDLSRNEVRELITLGLTVQEGSYRRLVSYFNIADSDYKRFLTFLSSYGCKVDYRSFRSRGR